MHSSSRSAVELSLIVGLSISTVAGVTLDSEGVLSIVILGRDVVHRFIPRAAPSLDLRKSV